MAKPNPYRSDDQLRRLRKDAAAEPWFKGQVDDRLDLDPRLLHWSILFGKPEVASVDLDLLVRNAMMRQKFLEIATNPKPPKAQPPVARPTPPPPKAPMSMRRPDPMAAPPPPAQTEDEMQRARLLKLFGI